MGCRNHPSVETALQLCWVCQNTFCGDCVVELQGRTMCGPCKAEAVARLEAGTPEVGGETERTPWDRRAELGIGRAVFLTWKAASLEPVRTFSRLDTTSPSLDVLWLCAIVSFAGGIGQIGSEVVWPAVLGLPRGDLPFEQLSGGAGFLLGWVLGALACAPIAGILYAFLIGGLQHLYLVVTKQARRPYIQTVRGYCYAQMPMLVAIVPFPMIHVAQFVGMAWMLVSSVFMIREVHRTTTMHAVIAVLWWLAAAFCCGVVLVAGILGIATASR